MQQSEINVGVNVVLKDYFYVSCGTHALWEYLHLKTSLLILTVETLFTVSPVHPLCLFFDPPHFLNVLLTFCVIYLLPYCLVPVCVLVCLLPLVIDWLRRLNDQKSFYNYRTTPSLQAPVKLFVAGRNGHFIMLP